MERPGVFVTSSHILPKYCPQAPVAAADFWTERCCFSLLAPRRRLLRTGRFLRSAGNVHVIFVSGTHSTRRFGMGTGNFCGLKLQILVEKRKLQILVEKRGRIWTETAENGKTLNFPSFFGSILGRKFGSAGGVNLYGGKV